MAELRREPRVLVMISGNGSNLQALLDSQPAFNVVHVLSNRTNAYGLTRASIHNIPCTTFALKPFLTKNPGKTREDYDSALAHLVLSHNPDLIVLAGWMHILSKAFLDTLIQPSDSRNEAAQTYIPIINLHPALPNQFDGANAISRAFEAFSRGEITKTGVMVHRVIPDVDKGEPIVVKEVPFEKGESFEAFEQRLHTVEHEAIVEGVRKMVDLVGTVNFAV